MSVHEARSPAVGGIDRTAPDRRAPLPSLTGLRFVAAAPVFAFHLSLSFIALNPFRDPGWAHGYERAMSKAGWAGVSFFFVLSGFLLMWRGSDSRGYRPFLRKRLVKIVPPHLVTWTVAMVLYAGAAAHSAWNYLPNLFLVNSWIPVHDVYLAVNIPSWSLCCELLFYLLFPLLAPLVRRIPVERLWWALAGCIAGTLLVATVTSVLPNTPTVDGMPISSLQFWFAYNFPAPRLFEFLAGMVLARLVAHGSLPRIRPLAAWIAVAVGYGAALEAPFTFSFIPLMLVPLLLLVASAVQSDQMGRRSWLGSSTMVWLGEISFAFYLVQAIVLITVRTTWQGGAVYSIPVAIADMVLIFGLAVACGWALYRFVEMPAMRRWSVSGRRVRSTPARVDDATAAVVTGAGADQAGVRS